MRLIRKALVTATCVISVVALCLELSWQHYVNFGGKRNRLMCEVVSSDGSSLPNVILHFEGGHSFRIIPLSGMGGGPPDRTIKRAYAVNTTAPGIATCEWPRIYLHLESARVGERILRMHHPRGTTTAHWEAQQPKYFADGSRDWSENVPGDYFARVELDLTNDCVYVEQVVGDAPRENIRFEVRQKRRDG